MCVSENYRSASRRHGVTVAHPFLVRYWELAGCDMTASFIAKHRTVIYMDGVQKA